MGRELKRVPFDFQWPLNKVWGGFLMPSTLRLPECPDCTGDGYSVEARAVAETFYPHQIGGPDAESLAWHDKIGQAEVDNLVAGGRLRQLQKREPSEDNPRDWKWVSVPRVAADVNAENRRGGMGGHDTINRSILIQFRCERLGIPHSCPRCTGEGNVATPEQRTAYENWQTSEPPFGDGYQVWETVSEGSPISPVFDTVDALVNWLVKEGYSLEAVVAFAASGWVPSMIVSGGVLYNDIESAKLPS